MSIDAFRFIVFSKIEGAELSFVIEHIEVVVLGIVMNERGENFLFGVSVRAEVSIEAVLDGVREV